MAVTRNYHGTTYICYNWYTGEYKETKIQPDGYGWAKPSEISYEDLDFMMNN